MSSKCVICNCMRFIQDDRTINSTYINPDKCKCGHSKINHSEFHPLNRQPKNRVEKLWQNFYK